MLSLVTRYDIIVKVWATSIPSDGNCPFSFFFLYTLHTIFNHERNLCFFTANVFVSQYLCKLFSKKKKIKSKKQHHLWHSLSGLRLFTTLKMSVCIIYRIIYMNQMCWQQSVDRSDDDENNNRQQKPFFQLLSNEWALLKTFQWKSMIKVILKWKKKQQQRQHHYSVIHVKPIKQNHTWQKKNC